jgi:hypothetical protein
MPARVASALGLPSRDACLTAYRERTAAVRAAYHDVFGRDAERSHDEQTQVERSRKPSSAGHPRSDADKGHSLQ